MATLPPDQANKRTVTFRHGMAMEHEFVAASGAAAGRLRPHRQRRRGPGFGDLREVGLLVEEGFTPAQAIQFASYNGALYLGLQGRIGSIAAGKDPTWSW